MLGSNVMVRVTKPCGSTDRTTGKVYKLNYGLTDAPAGSGGGVLGVYIVGVDHPVRIFKGKVVAVLHRGTGQKVLITAPHCQRPIAIEINDQLDGMEDSSSYTLDCLYEHSCGAVVIRTIDGIDRFLLIKNKRSCNWGFPKGHVESGETSRDTAKREVLEETGLHIDFISGFVSTSNYKIGHNVEKLVEIFLATTPDTQTVIQKTEIDDYVWLTYECALETLKFENDKNILRQAHEFLSNREGD